MEHPKVAVIIPCYEDQKRLSLCLQALANQDIEPELYKVLVIDNGSKITPADPILKTANFELLVEDKPGSYNARNKGIERASDFKYFAFTDSDCIPDRSWLKSAINFLETNDIDAAGGPIDIFCCNPEKPTPTELLELCFGFPQEKSIAEMHYSTTANLIVRASCFKAVGLFNGDLMSGGDVEWCSRLFAAGGKLKFSNEVRVRHPARKSLSEYLLKTKRVTHGAWARRELDKNILEHTSFNGLIYLITPPLKRSLEIFKNSKPIPFHIKSISSTYLYIAKLYTAYHFILCRLNLIKEAERR